MKKKDVRNELLLFFGYEKIDPDPINCGKEHIARITDRTKVVGAKDNDA